MHSRTTSTSAETNAHPHTPTQRLTPAHPHARSGHSPRLGLGTLAVLCGLAAPALAQPVPGFRFIQQYANGGPGSFTDAVVSGISDNGEALSGSLFPAAGGVDGFYWTVATGVRQLTIPEAPVGLAISGNGQTALVGSDTGTEPNFRLSIPGEVLSPLPLPSGLASGYPTSTNFSGSWAVGRGRQFATPPEEPLPVRWGPDGTPSLVPLPSGTSQGIATGVNDLGTRIVGTAFTPEGFSRGYVWDSQTGATLLPLPQGSPSNFRQAAAISGDGRFVVGGAINAQGQEVTTRWDLQTGEVLTLPLVNGFLFTSGVSISDDGSVITGFAGPDGSDVRAFIWTQESGQSRLANVFLSDNGISNAGDVIGIGRNRRVYVSGNGLSFGSTYNFLRPDGTQYAGVGIATIPTPSTALIASLTCVALSTRRRRAL